MKILVTVKRVPDPEQKLKLKGAELDLSAANWVLNPFDEYAVETALRLNENAGAAQKLGEVVVLTIGPADAGQQVRAALAMGADRGILVPAQDGQLDSLSVAQIIKAVVDKEKPDLLLMGKQAVDGDNNQVGQIAAGLLGWPQATFAAAITVEGKSLVVTREVDAGAEKKRVNLPAVVTVDLRIIAPKAIQNGQTPATHAYPDGPRYASLKGIMAAKKKELREVPLTELGVNPTPVVKVVSVSTPPARKAGVKVKDVDELVSKLVTEAKVI